MLPLVMAPAGWPHHLALGVSDPPGDAQALHAHAPVDIRYQYLAGGVNTGHGWATWNPNGSFVSMYVRESFAAQMIPVFTYYQMLQSEPAAGGDEQQKDLSNLRDAGTMRAYWADYSLLLRRVAQSAGSRLVVIHVEPDLWGYLEQAHAVKLARSFAQHLIALRNRLAPHVLLAWHLSTWGTGEDPTYSKPSLAHMDQLAAISAAFYESLHAHFDLVFNDVTDRDAAYYQDVEGNHRPVGPGRFRAPRPLHRRIHASHAHRGRALAAAAWRHAREQHLGPLPGQPTAVVARSQLRGPSSGHPELRRDRTAVRCRRVRQHDRSDRRRLLLPARAALHGPSAVALTALAAHDFVISVPRRRRLWTRRAPPARPHVRAAAT